ncbi:MAG: acetylxylan esterase [Chloroflexota bacterium]|nr:acetylxylan esterase [Chloroflexota bacterium]MDE2961282.1 acetylxylan esterase [Chloroflexota bacterium]
MTSVQQHSDAFWERIEAQLAETDPNIEIERDAFYSQTEWDVFRMRYTSAGGHRIFAWLSVPKEGGPFPALIRMPDYASVHDIIYTPLRERAVVMNATHRGQRNSDGQVRASYPGLLTDGIENASTYTLFGAYADAVRAVDVLGLQSIAELSGVVALTGAGLGASLALAAAARRPMISAVTADTPMALGHPTALEAGLGYPLAELGDYLRANPGSRSAVQDLLSVVNPVTAASQVRCPVLMSAGRFDRSLCPLAFAEELASALPDCDFRVYDGAAEGGGHIHGQARGAWLAARLGLEVS